MSKKLKVAILCGGPSAERGISLNSARSVCDHLQSETIEVVPIYFDHLKRAYEISRGQLYSNTPSDFDFKLHQSGKPLSKEQLKKKLKSVDIAFPAMHGTFGEDGGVQRMLEKFGVPYVGSPVEACKRAFDKYEANEYIKEHGFYTLPSTVLKGHLKDHKKVLDKFFKEHNIKRAAVKPATGGSSIGVESVSTVKEALEASHRIFSKRLDTRVVVEPFCKGIEFTVIILQNRFGLPVAVLPTEMELSYDDHEIFDYRKKYLATRQVTYHCPPRFDNDTIEKIQIQAEQLFQLLGMRDFARFDGWLLPDGNIWFSDFNPISGMEQNSFLFMQTSQIGMSHKDLLRYVVKQACRRYDINFPEEKKETKKKKHVNVLFGGKSAERQVSLMSGTNVWLKLRQSKKYEPHPYLLDENHNVWKLPYFMTLNHTVEEVREVAEHAKKDEDRLHRLKERVYAKLNLEPNTATEPFFYPEKMPLKDFIKKSDYVFIGLHGGIGENGELQAMLEKAGLKHNGSDTKGSLLGMNKYETAKAIEHLEKDGMYTAKKKIMKVEDFKSFKALDYKRLFTQLKKELGSRTLIVKPIGDGCSAGIARLFGPKSLQIYIEHAERGEACIPAGMMQEQESIIEMPPRKMKELMFEQYISTDQTRVVNDKLKWTRKCDFIEITMGLIGPKGKMKAMNPSLTVASGHILSLEEKFQGGTGVNITPPPQPYVKASATKKAKERMEKVAKALGLGGYARIDAFMHVKTGELIIIEANTLPGLTASTVIYHQALEEKPSMYPTDFLEKIIEVSGY